MERHSQYIMVLIVVFLSVIMVQAEYRMDDALVAPNTWKSGATIVKLSDDGKILRVSGNGVMADYGNDYYDTSQYILPPPWNDSSVRLDTIITALIIDHGVTHIGNNAFHNFHRLSSVSIPNSVISIGDYAFFQSALTSITIPGRVKTVGKWAFAENEHLTSVEIMDGVSSIGEYSFYICRRLKSITLGNSVTNIGKFTFFDCHNLISITVKNPVPPQIEDSEYTFKYVNVNTPIVRSANDNIIETKKIRSPKTDNIKRMSVEEARASGINIACLYVPKGSIDAYKSAEGWKDFVCIKPFPIKGVESK